MILLYPNVTQAGKLLIQAGRTNVQVTLVPTRWSFKWAITQ